MSHRLHRSVGMHAAGIVIGDKPLWEYCPVFKGAKDEIVTQFAKDEVEAAGLVTRHHFADGMAVFELSAGPHHDHILCMDCGNVEEFVEPQIEERQRAVAERLGFEISDHALVIYGHCRRANCPHRKPSSA